MERKCKNCGTEQCITKFPKAGVIKGIVYYRWFCGPCYVKSKMKRRNRLRIEYLELKKSLKCKFCGNCDFRVLDFHHRNAKEKDFNVADAIRRGFSMEKIKREIAKCDVLCSNCHRIETWLERHPDIAFLHKIG